MPSDILSSCVPLHSRSQLSISLDRSRVHKSRRHIRYRKASVSHRSNILRESSAGCSHPKKYRYAWRHPAMRSIRRDRTSSNSVHGDPIFKENASYSSRRWQMIHVNMNLSWKVMRVFVQISRPDKPAVGHICDCSANTCRRRCGCEHMRIADSGITMWYSDQWLHDPILPHRDGNLSSSK